MLPLGPLEEALGMVVKASWAGPQSPREGSMVRHAGSQLPMCGAADLQAGADLGLLGQRAGCGRGVYGSSELLEAELTQCSHWAVTKLGLNFLCPRQPLRLGQTKIVSHPRPGPASWRCYPCSCTELVLRGGPHLEASCARLNALLLQSVILEICTFFFRRG